MISYILTVIKCLNYQLTMAVGIIFFQILWKGCA